MSKKLIFPYALFCLFGVLFLLSFRNFTSASIGNSLCRFAESLVPSFFPIMVLSRQIYTNLRLKNGRFSDALCKLCGIPQKLLPIFFASVLCGYPTSAILCKKALDDRIITQKEAELATIIFSNASPAFVILLVGKGVFSNIFVGIALFTIQTFCTICASHIFSGAKECEDKEYSVKSESLAESVAKATHSILELGGFVVFFSLVSDAVKKLFSVAKAPDIAAVIAAGIIETTGGIPSLSRFPLYLSAVIVCLFCSTGGVSVFFQVSSLMKVSILIFLKVRGTVFALMSVCFCAVLKLFEVLSLL